MPYISINTSKVLTETEKDDLKTALGVKLTIIPGKVEAGLMVDISDNHTMYFAGKKQELAFVDIRCFRQTETEYKKAFATAVFEVISQTIGLPQDSIYLNHTDYELWGARGNLFE
jgi:phenylpyruvate tautomerase PptA (4-oxalocrotonate tautomerase family)